jgi:hypothetical protein
MRKLDGSLLEAPFAGKLGLINLVKVTLVEWHGLVAKR